RRRERVAQQEGLPRERFARKGELLLDRLDGFLALIAGRAVEKRPKRFMNLTVDESEPLLEVIARQRSARWRESTAGILICKVLHDGRAFGEQLATVEHQRR